MSYSALNTAISALSTLIMIQGCTARSHPMIIRFMNLRPSLPRYSNTWYVSMVLGYLKGLSPLEGLRHKDLSFKLVMLMAIITAQIGQTLNRLDMDNMTKIHILLYTATETDQNQMSNFSHLCLELMSMMLICVFIRL